MPSENPPSPSTTSQNSQVISPAQINEHTILQALDTQGGDPFEFLRRNGAPAAQAPALDPQEVSATAAKVEAEALKERQAAVPKEPVPESKVVQFSDDEEPKEPVTPPAEAEVPAAPEGEEPSESFKNLRTKFRETSRTAEEFRLKSEALEKKVKAYEAGEIVPEKISHLENEVQRLSKFEKLHALESSKEYQDKVAKPIQAKANELVKLFSDYGIPEEDAKRLTKTAVGITNRAQLNQFLSEHFGSDDLGAMEAKALVSQIRTVQAEGEAMRQEPASALEAMQRSSEAARLNSERTRITTVQNTAKSAFQQALDEIRAEGKVTELIRRDNDNEFNQNFVDPILNQAGREFGKLVTAHAKQPGYSLDPEVAKAEAKMVLLSQAAAIAVVTRNRAMDEAEALSQSSSRTHGLYRPSIGGGRAGPPRPVQEAPKTPEQEADSILQGVLARNQR